MKYSLSNRQSKQHLQEADEIMVAYKDRNQLFDFITLYPNIDLVLHLDYNVDIDWDFINQQNILAQNKLICACETEAQLIKCKENDIKAFYYFPIGTYYELNRLKKLNVCYIIVDAPLFFDLNTVKKYNIPIRIIPNLANPHTLLHRDSLYGTWVCPEDIDVYANYNVTMVEFRQVNPKEEWILFDIYKHDQAWIGHMDVIIKDFAYDAYCNMLIPDFVSTRLTCGQRCQIPGHECHICDRLIKLANKRLIQEYNDEI